MVGASKGCPSQYAPRLPRTESEVALRRYTLRLDGFVSVRANRQGGDLLTRPLVFHGTQLELKFSTSAGGRSVCKARMKQHAGGRICLGRLSGDLRRYTGPRCHLETWSRSCQIGWQTSAATIRVQGRGSLRVSFCQSAHFTLTRRSGAPGEHQAPAAPRARMPWKDWSCGLSWMAN